jgi:hypothetical protein
VVVAIVLNIIDAKLVEIIPPPPRRSNASRTHVVNDVSISSPTVITRLSRPYSDFGRTCVIVIIRARDRALGIRSPGRYINVVLSELMAYISSKMLRFFPLIIVGSSSIAYLMMGLLFFPET